MTSLVRQLRRWRFRERLVRLAWGGSRSKDWPNPMVGGIRPQDWTQFNQAVSDLGV